MDLDSIEAGLDFAEVIRDAVDSCAVLVALIGRQWLTLADEEGRRRLDDPDDYVRFEVQTALERGVRVIPGLVDGAKPLRRQQLPSELHKLARLNALEISYGRYQYDADRLLRLIERVLAAAPSAASEPDLRVRNTQLPDGSWREVARIPTGGLVYFSPDSEVVATTESGSIRLWESQTGRAIRALERLTAPSDMRTR
jgi:WD40 repeat protein